jgi:hypothetical protein
MSTVLALTGDASTLEQLQESFPDEVANGTAIIGGVIGVFTGDADLGQRLLDTGVALAVVDDIAIGALTAALDGLAGDPGLIGNVAIGLLGPAGDQLDPDTAMSLGGWLMQFSPAFQSSVAASPVSPGDPVGEAASCVQVLPPGPPPPESPLRAARFAGDPVLEGCLAGTHRMLEPETGNAVVKIQAALIDLGLMLPLHGADGIFGSETGQAVVTFKTGESLFPDDPVVGPGTMARLDAFFAS